MSVINLEEDARTWLHGAFPNVPRETWQCVEAFVRLLIEQGSNQNLIARSSFEQVWSRHIADSAQLAKLVPSVPSRWLDLGSGAGFPGLIIAVLTGHRVILVESRRLRVDFLIRAADTLGIADRIEIAGMPLDRLPTGAFDIITARAFAPLTRLLPLAHRFSTEKTFWVLPKGRGAQSELDQVSATWQGDFRLEPSLTDPEARIIVAQRVNPRAQRRERA